MKYFCGGTSSSSIFSSLNHSCSSSSVWWKDLISLGNIPVEDPVETKCRFEIGNGFITPFWEARWVDHFSLKEFFPFLFSVSSFKRVAVASMGGWVNGVWKWGNFGVSLSVHSDPIVLAEYVLLHLMLIGRNTIMEGRDKVSWGGSSEGLFSVASCYVFLAGHRYPFGPSNRSDVVLDLIWKVHVSFKIKAFGWRIFVNRLPTKDLLTVRGVPLSVENLKCAFCGSFPESCDHSFFKCDMVNVVWREMALWVGKPVGGMEEVGLSSFMDWYLFCKKKKVKEGKCGVIWLAILWIFWLTRNGMCFRNEGWVVDNTVWNIKSLLWKWSFFGEITHPLYSFYEFTKGHLYFLS
ncbi:uncharacterized protein LOC131605774 [Vicia villosa]|uniref:uncharacterized protein LOC131605774 n=1 Tax=Vicia villosa TaxID=3911 RepID=UPI00273AAC01|nr:uncharacterized protein LOC131605774 [Vicia villosa]